MTSEQEHFPAARVHITGSDIPLGSAPPAKRKRRAVSTRSFTLTSNDPVQEILPQSDSRSEASITFTNNQCTIGSSQSDAKNGGNSAANIPANITAPYPVNTTDSVWASAGTLPATISVVAIYEQPD